MRILALDLGPHWRGGRVQSLLVALGLTKRGHAVTIGVREGSPLALRATAAGLAVLPLPVGGEASPRLLIRLSRAARRFRPGVLWAGDSRAHGAAVWSRTSRRVPLVVHRGVVFPPGDPPLSSITNGFADLYIAVSESARSALLASGVPPGKVVVVSDGLPPSAFVECPVPPSPPFRLVQAGVLDGRKGQRIVVDILARLLADGLDAHVRFLGDGPARPRVEQHAKSCGVFERCTFEGTVGDVAARLAASHLLLLPSESEAAPLVLIETMAAGCPVLAHDVGGVAELTQGETSGRLVPSLGPDQWAWPTRELLLDSPTRAALVAAGRAATEGRTAETTTGLIEAEFERIVRSR
ncbi:MAG TPA: glycosyltransferase family 4 protein [Thermoanaerobaculia bacterium]|nr:glycosyltransferase family 4 protein [Thermoanaerobaculia bacterium]